MAFESSQDTGFLTGVGEYTQALKMEYAVWRDRLFGAEKVDPVFEGVVHDFFKFDAQLNSIFNGVMHFMKSVEGMNDGVGNLAESLRALSRNSDPAIVSGVVKMREAVNQIIRSDGPHSTISKLRRDMSYNMIVPLRHHFHNNAQIRENLETRQRRQVYMRQAKAALDDILKKTPNKEMLKLDKKYRAAVKNYEAATEDFEKIDKQVFTWLYILAEYQNDILDSCLQTLKYLVYEYYASGAHAISAVLPARMEFRPMVEMTPTHLGTQVDLEIAESKLESADYTHKILEKQTNEGGAEPDVIVNPLSLSSLVMQGFDEADARRALVMKKNDTQAALDYLFHGEGVGGQDGVRMPTSIARIKKLKLKKKEESERRAREEEARKVKEANETNAEGGESWKPYHQEVPSLFEDLMDLSGPPEEEALAFSPSASVPKPETPVSQSPSEGNLLDF